MPYKNIEDKIKYNRKYFRIWYERNGRTRNRNANHIQAIREWQKNHPERVQAVLILRSALKEGQIIKPKYCTSCHRGGRIVGHHEDYSKPLEVIWLCVSCHKLKHSKFAT